MSNCRTFNRGSRKEQPKQQNVGVMRVNQLAHDYILQNPEEVVKQLVLLFTEEKKVSAVGMLLKLASGAIVELVEQEPTRRPSLIDRWVAELKQEDTEKQPKEAEAAQEAAGRELGQIPEPETETTAVEPSTAQTASSNLSNTHVNEIGLPVREHSQIIDAPGSRSCRTTVRPATPGHESNQVMRLPAHRTA